MKIYNDGNNHHVSSVVLIGDKNGGALYETDDKEADYSYVVDLFVQRRLVICYVDSRYGPTFVIPTKCNGTERRVSAYLNDEWVIWGDVPG